MIYCHVIQRSAEQVAATVSTPTSIILWTRASREKSSNGFDLLLTRPPHGSARPNNMAVARPVRFLGALSIVLVFFLIYQLTRPTTPIAVPDKKNGDTIENMERDPLLDRTLPYYTSIQNIRLTHLQP